MRLFLLRGIGNGHDPGLYTKGGHEKCVKILQNTRRKSFRWPNGCLRCASALIFVCSCLLPAFANGTGAELETPDTEVVEAADPGTDPEPMDLYDEPAAVADEPEALDDDFGVADEPAAMDDDFCRG